MADARTGNDPQADRPPTPERPRSEPEIIVPGAPGGEHMRGRGAGSYRHEPNGPGWPSGGEPFVFIDQLGRSRRFKVSTPSPWVAVLVLLAVGIAAGLVLLLVLGAVLFWIPVLALLLAGLLAWARLRVYWRRLRAGWSARN